VRDFVSSVTAEYLRYKNLGEHAIAQLEDSELNAADPGDNSIAVIVWHIAGNFESRFTDFQTSDGEKPWRRRDDEFLGRAVTHAELREKWDRGWDAAISALNQLNDADLRRTVMIRRQPLQIQEALHRSLAHASYHIGQIVYIAKSIRGSAWKCLTIPVGGSEAYNANPTRERPAARA